MQSLVITITTMLISVVAFLAPLVRRLDLPHLPLLAVLGIGAWLALDHLRGGRGG